ncbi:beta-lactamase/transpeptidase-like protein [Lojkania enalia]|uniref:Beta-lactamase/transpeptidase-like protein n=1 Tax=Lojkania enalia TaxID=147567 RepID=A0A9P4KH77_9PLEO|nr:beta-lactamase/transpeptidase-like protein [Didymosphaeria enalia]
MTPSIALDTASTLRTYIDNATTRDKPALPGAIVHMVDKNNNKVFTYASSRAAQLSENSIALVHSLTKMVGAIAFMQLVEQGLAALDDSSVIEKVLPELAVKQVLTGYDNIGKPILVGKVGDITPRMLMNHTYGGGHSFFNPLMKKYMQDGWEKRNEVADPHQTILDAPLLWQPGTHTNYGQGFDWLATLIERLTNKNLATLLEENIFGKLGLKRLDFEETYGGDITTRPESKDLFLAEEFKAARWDLYRHWPTSPGETGARESVSGGQIPYVPAGNRTRCKHGGYCAFVYYPVTA